MRNIYKYNPKVSLPPEGVPIYNNDDGELRLIVCETLMDAIRHRNHKFKKQKGKYDD